MSWRSYRLQIIQAGDWVLDLPVTLGLPATTQVPEDMRVVITGDELLSLADQCNVAVVGDDLVLSQKSTIPPPPKARVCDA